MSAHIDLFYNTYANFTEQVLASVRAATFGEDIGQNSWVTADEYEGFIAIAAPDDATRMYWKWPAARAARHCTSRGRPVAASRAWT